MKREFSAGGLVFKNSGNSISILIAQHSFHKGWVFPKGLIGDTNEKESKEETAVREVEEETGIIAEIVEPLSPFTFWYQMKGEKRKKTVYYYIMKYLGGDTSKHDMEMQAVEWVPIEDVEKRLTYKGDRKVFQSAKNKILELGK